jgi:hypothetical protein
MRKELSEMRKLLSILILSATLMLLLVPSAMAQDGYLEVRPGDGEWAWSTNFADNWIELDPALGGPGAEVPQGDDFIRGGPVSDGPQVDPFGFVWPINGIYQHGIPLGFEFDYWGATYDNVWLATNGFMLFRGTPLSPWDGGVEPGLEWNPVLGVWVLTSINAFGDSWNWWPWQLPIAEPPNNFIAGYWTDLVIGDNGVQCVSGVDRVCVDWGPPPWPNPPGHPDNPCFGFEYLANTYILPRPRGRLLYATIGEPPNQVFVAEWLRAKNYHTGNLVTFQIQIEEGTGNILYLYQNFQPKQCPERDPVPYFEVPSVLAGLENAQGTMSAGDIYAAPGPGPAPFGFHARAVEMFFYKPTFPINPFMQDWWRGLLKRFVLPLWPMTGASVYPQLPQVFNAGDMLGFIPL